ncbi:MAG: MarR family transcriptional regulator, partial [Planctomycetota bacterium]
MELTPTQHRVLAHLADSDRPLAIGEIAQALGIDQSQVAAACVELRDAGATALAETPYEEFSLGQAAQRYVDAPLPERVIVKVLAARGGRCAIPEIPNHCDLTAADVGQSLRWLAQRGWAKKDGGDLKLLKDVDDEPTPDEQLIAALAGGRVARDDEIRADGIDLDAARRLLEKRKGFLTIKQRTDRRASITDAGRELLESGATARPRVTQLTPEMLSDGSWREADLAPYDVTLAAKTRYPGKEHAFQRT